MTTLQPDDIITTTDAPEKPTTPEPEPEVEWVYGLNIKEGSE